jgi:cyclophilin family peptidyl-prolyl cis-trans isomerase
MKRIACLVLACLFVFSALLGAGESTAANAVANAEHPRVMFETNMGRIVVECLPDKAPKTVDNFLNYVREGRYDGTIFHRVINGFVIQGGGFDSMMRRVPTFSPIVNEARKDVRNLRGTLSMARTGDPHSATNQFFINLRDNANLDFTQATRGGYGYCVFAKVVAGMSVVDRIAEVETKSAGHYRDVPVEPVVIVKAYVMGTEQGEQAK